MRIADYTDDLYRDFNGKLDGFEGFSFERRKRIAHELCKSRKSYDYMTLKHEIPYKDGYEFNLSKEDAGKIIEFLSKYVRGDV